MDGIGLKFNAGIITGNTHPLICQAQIDVLYVPVPAVLITEPYDGATLPVNNPRIAWWHMPSEDSVGGQTHYRVRIYDTFNGGIFSDTGVIAGADTSYVAGPLDLQKTYRVIVNTAQTTDGIVQWSDDASHVFALDVTGPTVTVNAPTGVIGTTSPTVTWTHHPGTGAQTGQTYYRVRAFVSTDLANPRIHTGAVPGSASSARIGPLDPAFAWRLVVTTALTTYGVVQWSPEAATNITIDVVPALIASVNPAPHAQTAAIALTIPRVTTSPLWQTIDVEATYDGGATWIPVRGATALAVNGDTAYVTDWEAPERRAGPLPGAGHPHRPPGHPSPDRGSCSPETSWHLAGDDVWIKDPDHPERNVKVCLSQLPEALYDRTVRRVPPGRRPLPGRRLRRPPGALCPPES